MIGRPQNTDLLKEIEALSRALSLPTSSNLKPKSTSSSTQKKPSFWNWKPLKALSHIRQRRFDCVFSLHVHSIENLPAALSDAALSVYWKRSSDPSSSAACTSSVNAFDGVAEFEETLTYRCSVYGARKGSSTAKYEARNFLIFVSLSDAPEVDLGKQMVDVTRLLPLTLEELEDREKRSGKWSTSFRLSGKGKGASLNVSFGFLLIDERTVVDTSNLKMHDDGSVGKVSSKGRRWARSQSVEDVRVLHEILPSLKSNASSLADTVEKLEIGFCEFRDTFDLQVGSKLKSDKLCKEDEVIEPKAQELAEHVEDRCLKEPDLVMIEQCVEVSAKDQFSAPVFEKTGVEGLEQGNQAASKGVAESFDDSFCFLESRLVRHYNQTTMEHHGLVSDTLSHGEPSGLEALNSETMTPITKSHTENKSDYLDGIVQRKSFSSDDSTEAIASEFLSMLGIDHSPVGLSSESGVESPRERLWKQFEEENLGAGNLLFGLDTETEHDDELLKEHNLSFESENFDLSPMVHEAEREFLEATQGLCHFSRAKLLENSETEDLMKKWGLNEKAFQCSPSGSNNGFGSHIDLPSEVPLMLPPLAEGLGSCVQTKDGGFLRSMSPALFRNSKCNASLIMQASSPVVVPAEMGSGVTKILHRLASIGVEKLSSQAKKLMPLEDVTGKTIQQIAREATSTFDSCKRSEDLPDLNTEADVVISQKPSGRREKGRILSSSALEGDSDYVSVEDLAPLAMDKIEALSMEGLRIQSGMTDEEPPSNISSQFIGNVSSLEGKGADDDSLQGLEGTAGLQLLDVKGNADDVDGLMSLSITLEEWMRLDSGIVVDGDQTSARTSKILAAHQASSSSSNLIIGGWKKEKTGGKRSGRSWGLLGSNFTVALMVQLRDALRNYDPVGTPMLALVQVERVFVPPKPKIYTTVSEKGNNEEDETEPEPETKSEPILVNGEQKAEEEAIPQFKITDVHVAGLKTGPDRKNIWGNSMHQQSGSRWLIANGMGKSNKHPFMKSKPVSKPSPATTTVHAADAFWSISSLVRGIGSWKEMLAIHSHVRNPNVNFPKEGMRLR